MNSDLVENLKTVSRTNTTILKTAFKQIDAYAEEKQIYKKVANHQLNQIQKYNTGEKENTLKGDEETVLLITLLLQIRIKQIWLPANYLFIQY